MATFAQTIINAAYGRSTFPSPSTIAAPPELVRHLSLYMKEIYAAVREEAPWYFVGDPVLVSSSLIGSTRGWVMPSNAAEILALEGGGGAVAVVPVGAEVHAVPFDRLQWDVENPPRVYAYGRNYFSVGAAGDPNPAAGGDRLTVYASVESKTLNPAVAASHADNQLDSTWRDGYNDMLVDELACYMGEKEQNFGNVQPWRTSQARLLDLLKKEAIRFHRLMVARHGQRPRLAAIAQSGQ